MVKEYVAQYGGTASGVNADVAEAYSVGQVMAQAVAATKGTDNAKIISYLHSGVELTSVQGPVKFDALGENGAAAAFVFQWQKGSYRQGLPLGQVRPLPVGEPGSSACSVRANTNARARFLAGDGLPSPPPPKTSSLYRLQ